MRGTGKHLPSVPAFLGKTLLAINGATKGLCVPSPSSSPVILSSLLGDSIADIERVHQMRLDDPDGYEAHLADARATYSNFTSFEEWAKAQRRSNKRDKNWNQVSAVKLATGQQ